MPGSDDKRYNTTVADPLWLSKDIQDSLFLYKGHSNATNYTSEIKQITAKSAGGFGGKTVFEIDLNADFLGKVVLEIPLSALTVTGDTVTQAFIDFLGFALCESIEVEYGTNRLPKVLMQELHAFWYDKMCHHNEQPMVDDLVAGNKTAAQRHTLATAAQTLYIELPLFWVHYMQTYLHQHSQAQVLRISITHPSLQKLTTHAGTDGTEACTMTSPILHSFFYHVENAESNMITAMHRANQGVLYSIPDIERVNQVPVDSGATSAVVKLDNLRLPVRGLVFFLRTTTDQNSAGGNTANNYFNYQAITSFKVVSSAGDIVRSQKDVFNRKVYQPKLFDSIPGDYVYVWFWDPEPSDKKDGQGHLSLASGSGVQLELVFPALAANSVVDCFAYSHNMVQAASGDIQLVFT